MLLRKRGLFFPHKSPRYFPTVRASRVVLCNLHVFAKMFPHENAYEGPGNFVLQAETRSHENDLAEG